jgi:hypothetical protein
MEGQVDFQTLVIVVVLPAAAVNLLLSEEAEVTILVGVVGIVTVDLATGIAEAAVALDMVKAAEIIVEANDLDQEVAVRNGGTVVVDDIKAFGKCYSKQLSLHIMKIGLGHWNVPGVCLFVQLCCFGHHTNGVSNTRPHAIKIIVC